MGSLKGKICCQKETILSYKIVPIGEGIHLPGKNTTLYKVITLVKMLADYQGQVVQSIVNLRVATVWKKCLENEIFSRSGKSQGILWKAREI